MMFQVPGPCLTTAIWRCCKPISQWQCSFHLKAALPLVERLATMSDCTSKTPTPQDMGWSFSLFLSQVEGIFYVNDHLERLMFDELKQSCRTGGYGGFLPGVKQIANVAALPGIVGVSLWMYWWHSARLVSPLFIHWRYHSLALVWVRLLTLWWFSARLWYIDWLLAGYTLCHSPSIS